MVRSISARTFAVRQITHVPGRVWYGLTLASTPETGEDPPAYRMWFWHDPEDGVNYRRFKDGEPVSPPNVPVTGLIAAAVMAAVHRYRNANHGYQGDQR